MPNDAFFQFILNVFMGPLFVVCGIAVLFVSFLVIRRANARMYSIKENSS